MIAFMGALCSFPDCFSIRCNIKELAEKILAPVFALIKQVHNATTWVSQLYNRAWQRLQSILTNYKAFF